MHILIVDDEQTNLMLLQRVAARVAADVTVTPFDDPLAALAACRAALPGGADIALSHHEKLDGSGYPRGLAGDAIPLAGRIVAVADVFDALTSARPYKKAWETDRARDFLTQHSGDHFDPARVAAFIRAWDGALAVLARFSDAPEPPPPDLDQVLA